MEQHYRGVIKSEFVPVKVEYDDHSHHHQANTNYGPYLQSDVKTAYCEDYSLIPASQHSSLQTGHLTAHKQSLSTSSMNHSPTLRATSGNALAPSPTHHNDKFKCEYCEKGFSSKGNLIVHKRTHTLERPYSCNECGKSFTAKGNLNTHLLSHSEFRPFTCGVCGKGFITKGNLTVHLRSHSKDKPYECETCSKRFTTKGNLVTHCITHKEIKPFHCHYCNKQFSTNNNLTIHQRTHTQERPFHCSQCTKSFYSKGTLSAHIKSRHCPDKNAVAT